VIVLTLYNELYISDDMDTLSFSDTRANLKAVMDRVVADRIPVAVTRQRGEGVVMISQSEWDSIEETLYLLQSPANAKRLLTSIAELDAGRGEEHELIDP
jgi:antitoxin YefM